MVLKKAARVVLPLLIAVAAAAVLHINASISFEKMPLVKNGVLDLSAWDERSAFEITGEWGFYWDRLLSKTQIQVMSGVPVLVQAPGEWNFYDTGNEALPGFGQATYHIRVTGAQPNTAYGLRIQDQASAYKLYIDDTLLAQNGAFGDSSAAPAFDYRPQLVSFTAGSDSFDLILQISNHAYASGGMWEPVVFGTAAQITAFGAALSGIAIAAVAALGIMCLFFIIFFAAAQRRERDVLTLAGIGLLVIARFSLSGDMAIAAFFPTMPIAGFGWIDYISMLWIQFLLFYFLYCAFGDLVKKWQTVSLLFYAGLVSLAALLLPFEVMTSAYMILNIILLLVFLLITITLARAAWQKRTGATALYGAMALNLALTFYAMFVSDSSLGYYLLTNSSPEYLVLFVTQCVIVAQRYSRAQRVEIAFLKGQIRPHFIHNALTGIASTARSDPARTRDLLVNMSSYLRGFYDYDSGDLITMEKELALVRAYADIEQMRFGDRVKLNYEVESERLLLPPLILQPLVENAFIHGLREKEEGGTVTVFARRVKRGKARIGVRDNGVGFGVSPSKFDRHGVGIENINQRLARLYRTKLVFSVPEGGGCEVTMEIPWKEASDGESASG